MLLTLNQTLFLIVAFAFVVAIVFLVLFLIQLRRTAREGERTLMEIRELAEGLKSIERKIDERIDDVGVLLESSKKTVSAISEIAMFLTTKMIRPASRFWPILFPIFRMGWRFLKKKKET